MKKYKTYAGEITEVEVEKETKSFIWVKEKVWTLSQKEHERVRRTAKRSNYDNYFDTFEAAKNFLVTKAQRKVDSLKEELQSARSRLGQAESLKEKSLNQ